MAGVVRRRWPATIALLLLPACGDNVPPPGTAVVRDSAGIRIVENTSPIWQEGEEWHLTDEAVVDIGGGHTEEEQPFQVMGAAKLSDGNIVVGNRGSQELRLFALDGRFRTSFGGRGGGPGEFQSLTWLRVLDDDSVITFDSPQRRLSVFHSQIGYVRSFTVVTSDDVPIPQPHDIFADRSLLVQSRVPLPSPSRSLSGLHRPRLSLFRFAADGSPGPKLGEFAGREILIRADGERGMIMAAPFGRSTEVFVTRNDFYVASNDSYKLRRFNRDGQLLSIVRRIVEPLAVTEEDVSELRRSHLEGSSEQTRSVIEDMLDEMPLPLTMPSYEHARVDALSNVWVKEYNRPGDNTPRWSVFDSSGVWLGTLTFPVRFEPLDIGSDYVLGLWRNEDDVEHVRMYQLVKP